MSIHLRKYRKSFGHSYTFGVYPTLELLKSKPEYARQVLLYDVKQGGEGVEKVRRMCRDRGIPVLVAPRAIRKISGRGFPAVGVFRKYRRPICQNADHVVLVRPQYEGNLGTIIRTMIGFGISDIAMIRPALDLLAPSVVRGSMGAVFQLAWTYFGSLHEYERAYRDHEPYYFTEDGNLTVGEFVPRRPFSLVFGSEGPGLPPAFRNTGTTVRIAHGSKIDSLNLGVAVGIVLHQVASRRGA